MTTRRNLSIDGTDEFNLYSGFAKQGPWAVHDDDNQQWIATGLRFRWMAELIRALALKGIFHRKQPT